VSSQTLTRREKQRHTRKCLLEAAAQIFSKQGLEGASIDQVAQTAGYTKGAFYANFKSKEELFLVMLDERFSRELERLDQALAGTGDKHAEAHAAAMDFIHFAGDPDWAKLYFQFVAHAARDEDFRQELATRMKAMRARIAEIFARWQESYGVKPVIPVEDVTAIICFMGDGFLVDRMIEPDLSEDLYTTLVGVFLRGLQALAEEQQAQ
jgi:AcrR family transcriptional regulator